MALFQQSMSSQIIWFLLFMVFILFYPKYMFYKMISEMESVVRTLENYVNDATEIIIKTSENKLKSRIGKKEKNEIKAMLDFFVIPPVDLDPYGILKKIEYVIDQSEEKFESFAGKLAKRRSREWEDNIIALIKGAISLNMIAKILKHYVEFAKKTGNLQITMLVHMNLPMFKKIGKASFDGVKAISEGKPIGDGIGPMIAANLIKSEKNIREIEKDVALYEGKLGKRKIYVLKAFGSGAALGKIGGAVKKLAEEKKNEVAKIITIDAGLKLEGEETGKVVYGIGAAIGDPGPEKAKIEEAAMKLKIPLEAIVIKMGVEEAISPMTKKIGKSVEKATKIVKRSVKEIPEDKVAIIVGVGNTCGIGNSKASIKDIELVEEKKEKEKLSLSDKIMRKLLTPPPQKPPKEESE